MNQTSRHESSGNPSDQDPLLSRRQFLGGAAALTALLVAGCSSGHEVEQSQVDLSFDASDLVTGERTDSYISALRSRAEELGSRSVEDLASTLLEKDGVNFDDDYPRIRESMTWAGEKGVFPLVDPVGNIEEGVNNVSSHVPVQKPLLVTLNLLSDAGIEYTITSISTSSEHGKSSHHYYGRGVDLRTPQDDESKLALMQFVNLLNEHKIIAIDESFAPGNPGKLNLDKGKPSDVTEGDHIHISTKQEDPWHEIELRKIDVDIFSDDNANKIANSLGITPASYFNMSRAQGEKIAKKGGFSAPGASLVLLELFPAEVRSKRKMIESAAKEANIPANFLATIATIESAGMQDASSGAGAHGVVQVVPRFHRERIDRISKQSFELGAAGDADRAKYLQDNPGMTLRIGADYIAELLKSARNANPDLDPNHPAIYARAAAGYNGGPANTKKPFSEWALESQLYANFANAFYIDVSVAAELADQGIPTEKREEALVSQTMWARMVAFRALGGKNGYADYSNAYRQLEAEHPGCGNQDDERLIDHPVVRTLYNLALAGYQNFDNKALSVAKGLTPGLQFWMAHGGFGLLNQSPANAKRLQVLSNLYGG